MTPSVLTWGVKGSLLRYVVATEGGSVSVGGDAGLDADGRGVFPGAWLDAAERDTWGGRPVLARYRGVLRLRGHGGLLSIEVSSPWIVGPEDTPELFIEDVDDASGRSSFALLEPLERDRRQFRLCATLTASGAEHFFGNYRAGEILDAAKIEIGRELAEPALTRGGLTT